MSNGGINTTGGININFPVTGTFGALFGGGGSADPSDAFRLPNKGLKNLVKQQVAQSNINDAIESGNTPKKEDVKKLAELEKNFDDAEERFLSKIANNPKLFTKAGIPLGITFLQAIWLATQTKTGQKNLSAVGGVAGLLALAEFLAPTTGGGPAGRVPPRPRRPSDPILPPDIDETLINSLLGQIFLPSLGRSATTSPTGGSTVPFITSPIFGQGGDIGGFGGFLESVAKAGATILPTLGVGRPQPQPRTAGVELFPRARQASSALIPFARGLLPTLPQIGAGAIGGEFADALQNLFTGGASTLDDTAAFTDPVPGSCRPKMHVKVNPCTGKGTWFTPRGRPLVFSGDMAACKRVDRVAKRLNKAMPKRHHHHRAKR